MKPMSVVRDFIMKHKLIHMGDTIVVGVSGGPDSMALLHFLNAYRHEWKLKLIAAHVDHSFRGEASREDLLYVETYCQQNNITFEGTCLDVPSYIEAERVSSQVGARELRYRFFARVMAKYKAQRLALGHHGDDQVETMLMREVRGSYGFSLAGIPVRRSFESGEVIRPLLCVTKEDLVAYCRDAEITPREDASNDSNAYTRNRFRKEVLPFIKKENRNVHTAFQRRSDWLTEDERFLLEAAKEKLPQVVSVWECGSVDIQLERFSSFAKPLQRRMIHLILSYLYNQNLTRILPQHIEQVLALFDRHHASATLDFPEGLKVIRSYETGRFSFTDTTQETKPYAKKLSIPGEVNLPFGVISGHIHQSVPSAKGKDVFIADANRLSFPLIVRTRRPGDRIQLKNGSHKLKKLFIDNKIDRDERATWPIVEDAGGNILWVVGLKHADMVKATKDTTRFLILTFENFTQDN